MPATSIQSPFSIFTDIDGQPLEQGQVWLGTAGNNPISSPITAYWDAALTQVVTQPVTTRGGYPLNGTAVGRLYVNADFSILVRNRSGYDVLSALSATERYDSSLVTFVQAGLGAVVRTAQAKMRDIVSVKDFGAVGDGVADDTVAIQAAVNAARNVYIPEGSPFYKCTSPITLRQDTTLEGANKQNTQVKFFACDGFIATSSGAGAYDIQIRNLFINGDDTGTTKDGIRIDGTSANFGRVDLDNLVVANFTRDGVSLIRPIVSRLNLVQSSSNGRHGFYIKGDGTSVNATVSYAASNTLDGWHIENNLQYSSFVSCASDSNGRHGYFFNGTASTPAEGITLVSCGSETNAEDQFKFGGTLGLTLDSIFTFPGSPPAGGHYINLDGCRHVTLSGIRMEAPVPAGKYALNIDTLAGTQFPTNIRGIGCLFSSVNNTNDAYSAFTANTSSVWIAPTLTNGWVNFGGSEATAGYYKDQFGVVHLKGTIKDGSFLSAAFTLPAGYRPSQSRNFGTVSNGAFGFISIASTGPVIPGVGSTAYISLDGLYFLAEQ
jgi:hypothetical protein